MTAAIPGPEPAAALPPENSFPRLQDAVSLLLSPTPEQAGLALEMLFLWPPATALFVEDDGAPLRLLASGLNSFQVLRLIEAGIAVHYRTADGAFAPWGRRLVDALPAGSIAGPDGRAIGVLPRAGRDYHDAVEPVLPAIELAEDASALDVDVPLRLIPGEAGQPELLMFRAASASRLVRLLGWDRPLGRREREWDWARSCRLSLLETGGQEVLLVRLPGGGHAIDPRVEGPLVEAADLVFRNLLMRQVFVQQGRVVTPELPYHLWSRLFEPGHVHLLFEEDGAFRHLKAIPFEFHERQLTDLGAVLMTLRRDRVTRFVGRGDERRPAGA